MKKFTVTAVAVLMIKAAMSQGFLPVMFDPIKEPIVPPMEPTFQLISSNGIAINEIKVNGTWRNKEKFNGMQDSHGNQTVFLTQRWDTVANQWAMGDMDLTQNFTYNAQGKVLTMDRWLKLATINITSHATFTYDANGRYLPVRSVDTVVQGGGSPMGLGSVDSIVYDGSGKIIERINSRVIMGFGMPQSKIVYAYNTNGKVSSATTYSFSGSGVPEFDMRETYGYDASGNIITVFKENYNSSGSAWENDQMDTFVYNAGNKLTGKHGYTWDGGSSAWRGDSWQDVVYTGNNITEVYDKNWVGSAWVNNTKGVVSYNASGKPTVGYMYKWTGSAYESEYSERITWSGGTSGLAKNTSAATSVEVYPNPASNELNIVAGKSNVAYQLMSINGQVMNSGNFTGKTSLNVSGLPAGVYFVRISSNEGNEVLKFIKD